jgi:hypothetical protein
MLRMKTARISMDGAQGELDGGGCGGGVRPHLLNPPPAKLASLSAGQLH